MIKIFAHLALTTLTLMALTNWFPEFISVDTVYTAFLVAVLFGVLQITVKPLLVLLTLPLSLITFGLFSLVLNGLLFWFLASFVEGFAVAGFIPAFLSALVLSTVNALISRLT